MYLYNYIHSKHDLNFMCIYIYTSKYDFKISIHKNKVLLLKKSSKEIEY